MSNIRRYFKKGRYYFLTHVTYERKPILIDNVSILNDAIKSTQNEFPFEIIAMVILPEHFHIIIDPLDTLIPGLMRKIKLKFSTRYKLANNLKKMKVWQNRYWDHEIRDQEDLNNHIDYIHYNPVKHNIVKSPFEWPCSTIKRFDYADDWGSSFKPEDFDYGE